MFSRLKKGLLCGAALLCTAGYAEAQNDAEKKKQKASSTLENPSDSASVLIKTKEEFLKDFKLNFLLRNAIEIPGGSQTAHFKTSETRMELTGKIKPSLSFRVRFRLNRPLNPLSSDNSPGSIDHAAINWNFGKGQRWSLNLGKQSASIGSWEFDQNPTYEYQYSDFINYQTNIFLTAARLGYQPNENQTFYMQFHNTWNNDFQTIHRNTIHRTNGYAVSYAVNGLEAAKIPMGVYWAWVGKLFDGKWQTFYSYNISQFAKNKTNQSVALGNKAVLPRWEAYLDLQFQTLGMDYANLVSPAINDYLAPLPPTFAQHINYKSATLRVDWEFIQNWFITAKGIYENASQLEGDFKAGRNFRNKYSYLLGLEYKPIKSQHMKIFGYYYNNSVRYDMPAAVDRNVQDHLFSAGFLYFINVL